MDALASRITNTESVTEETILTTSIEFAKIDGRLNNLESDTRRIEKQILSGNQKLEDRFKLLIELTENRFLWTILTVLASNVLPLVFHALNLI